ncbi:hypothetical protein IWQ56_006689, partial [Coemansia nantahalensis]
MSTVPVRVSSATDGPPVGLAQLADNAVAAAAQQQQRQQARFRRIQPGAGRHKELPTPPDRVALTMEAAGVKATTAAPGSPPPLVPGSPCSLGSPPPLPRKERPRIPHGFAAHGLQTHAELALARDRPSSTRLFGSEQPAEPGLGLREWLDRAALLPPAGGAAATLPPPPEAALGPASHSGI